MKLPRKILHWEKLRGVKGYSALLIATAMGAGLSPVAPGTMGALLAMPLAYYTIDYNPWLRAGMWLALLLAGIWASKVLDQLMASQDNQNIVMDEVVGLGISAWTHQGHMRTLIAAFILFRFFDIVKPFPVRQLDEWSKIQASKNSSTSSAWWGGFGVMADDVVAGFQALIVILILQYFQLLP